MARTFEFIVVHHAASYDAGRKRVVHQGVAMVRLFHVTPKPRGRGFRDIAYHRYVEVDGKIRVGRVDAVPGAHTEGFNDRSLGICVSGHADHEAFNAAQTRSLVAQCAAWCRLYSLGPERVIGHREAPAHGAPPVGKSCPGKLTDMDQIRELVRVELGGGSHRAGVVVGDVARCDPDEVPPTRRDGSPQGGKA